MKKIAALLSILLLIFPVWSLSTVGTGAVIRKAEPTYPGEIIALSCSDPYPMLGQPVYLLVTVQGNAGQRFNETVVVTDEFNGLVATTGEITWCSGIVTEKQINITVGKLPQYTKKIAWYPSVVGNHTFHVVAGAFPEKQLNISVSFDVEGIIAPSLGCPSIIIKSDTNQMVVTISEERNTSEELAQILQVELQDIDSSSYYHVENNSALWQTWIKAGTDILEDELIASYTIDSIPDGFYNISVTTTKRNYSWPHAVKIQNTKPSEYTVVQLTDIHIGKYANFINKKKELIRLFTYLNDNLRPDFVILTGDSVDWYNQKSRRNVYADLQEAILSSDSPVYTTPGNHERYGNSLLFLYFPFTNLTPYHRFLNPLSDYSVTYGNMNFVFLDSGYEYSRWEIKPQLWNPTPEGSGLTSTQMYLLEHAWGNDQMNQIISMHHPAVNNENDTGIGAIPNDLPSGNNECIAHNRGAFITYCLTKNVSLVLTGHTHENHVFTADGKETSNYSAWPLFVQTDSATLSGQENGGRVVTIKNSTVISYEYLPFQ
ncbi:MAG TPA: metallophosphoesterase [Candidatus Thermoplasmatota archaeon]|nr:metallophosphoesterase [Candidatus Thermoplasmatota archaeon]